VTVSETYLRELRRALPVGCRRRLISEVREHFVSAVEAEAEHGVSRAEAERLTIDRLGPAEALADQLLDDLRSGALGRAGRLAVALTVTRLAVLAAAAVIAIAVGGVLVAARSSSTLLAREPKAIVQEAALQRHAAAQAKAASRTAAPAEQARAAEMQRAAAAATLAAHSGR
jgi:hypothetical protein